MKSGDRMIWLGFSSLRNRMMICAGSPWARLYSSRLTDAGHRLVVIFHAINFFVGGFARALRADENAGDAEVNQFFVGVVAVEQNRVGRQINAFDVARFTA